MGVASKLRGVKGGHAAEVEMVADFKINSSIPPIPVEATSKQDKIKITNTAAYTISYSYS